MHVSKKSRRHLRHSMIALASALLMPLPALADPVPCEHFPATSGPDGIWGTADDVLPRTTCGAIGLSAAQGSTNLGTTRATLGATAIGQGVIIESSAAVSDSNLSNIGEAPNASVGIGFATRVDGDRNVAVGANSRIGGLFGEFLFYEDSVAVGSQSLVLGDDSVAMGSNARIYAADAVAVGSQAIAGARGATVVGAYSISRAEGGVAIGRSVFVNSASNPFTSITTGAVPAIIAGTAIGDNSRANDESVALGGYAVVGVRNAFTVVERGTAIGAGSLVSANGGTALGVRATASATNSVAIGAFSVADQENTISFGDAGTQRRLTQVGDGTGDFDAVNMRQLRAASMGVSDELVAWFGAGAAYAGGVFTAPVYVIQSNNYSNVGAAFAAVDAEITDINTRIAGAGGIQGERGYSAYELAVQNGYGGSEADWLAALQGPQGPSGPAGPEGPAGGGPRSVVYDSDERDTLTLAGTNGTTLSNVANGVADMDAVNLRQMQAGDAAALQSANTYTDTVAVQTLESANAYTDSVFAAFNADVDGLRTEMDDRFRTTDRRIDRMGAMTSAMTNMAINASGSQSPRGRIAVGAGFQGGEQALSIGYGRKIGNRGSFSIGGAFGGGERSAGVGFGMDL